MSASAEGSASTTKAVVQDPPDSGENNKDQQKAPAPLEEDDEFEDFPVEGMSGCMLNKYIKMWWDCNTFADWTEEEAQMPEANAHLWDESWDDDDTSEEFLAQLK